MSKTIVIPEGNLYVGSSMISVKYVAGYSYNYEKDILKVQFKNGNYLDIDLGNTFFSDFEVDFKASVEKYQDYKYLVQQNHELRCEINTLKKTLDETLTKLKDLK